MTSLPEQLLNKFPDKRQWHGRTGIVESQNAQKKESWFVSIDGSMQSFKEDNLTLSKVGGGRNL